MYQFSGIKKRETAAAKQTETLFYPQGIYGVYESMAALSKYYCFPFGSQLVFCCDMIRPTPRTVGTCLEVATIQSLIVSSRNVLEPFLTSSSF